MSYKDKDKQREAVKQAVRRYRQKSKGITRISNNVIPGQAPDVIPGQAPDVIPGQAPDVIPGQAPDVIPTLKRISQPGVGDNDGFYEVEAPESVRPVILEPVRPEEVLIPKEAKPYAGPDGKIKHIHEPEPQSYNPMMVGYVPKTDCREPSTKLFREECITCEHLGGDENDRAVCAVVDGSCVYPPPKPEPQSHNSMMVGYVPPESKT